MREWLSALNPIERWRNPAPVVAVVPLAGIIGRIGPLRRGLALRGVAAVLERAFKMKHLKAVALSVNSPGGSPVQSSLIARRIRVLADEHRIPVFAFAEDVAASGGYWLLSAGDELYADESSIIGSIGVVSSGFGFPELLKRYGVERRVHTAGRHKAALDPFRPEQADEVEHLQAIQESIHDAFRNQIRERRGERLKAAEDELFSGRYWSGRQALDLGLIDGLGDLRTIMRQRYGEKVRLRPVGGRQPWWRRRFGLTTAEPRHLDGEDWASGLAAVIEERLMWGRFGL